MIPCCFALHVGEIGERAMQCPKCRATSPPGRRFCINCGQDLQQGAARRGSRGRGSAVTWIVVAMVVVAVITAVAVVMLILGDGGEPSRVIIVTEEITRVITNTPPAPAETPSPATTSPLTGIPTSPKMLALGILAGDQP